jgi:hypothetical protein
VDEQSEQLDPDKPWRTEPNSKTFESSGYVCTMKRNPETGVWCGYVAVPAGHPWYGLARTESVTPVVELEFTARTGPFDLLGEAFTPKRPVGQIGLTLAVDVHGGVTYAGKPSDNEDWTFGFDCQHAGDVMPRMLEKPGFPVALFDGWSYRDLDYVTGQCARLAAQLRIVERRGLR